MGYDRLDTLGEIWIFGKSIQKDKEFIEKYKITLPKKTGVDLDMKFWLTRIKIIERNKI